jgi:multidrug efflux pump subunit AcrB
LPEEVRREGVTVTKVSSATLQFVSVYSPNGRYDDLFLSNYVKVSLLDRLASLPGVGGASLPGEREYAMRIWLNPDKLATLGLTAADVRTAVDSQNQPPEARGSGRPAASPPRRRTSIPGECPRAPP